MRFHRRSLAVLTAAALLAPALALAQTRLTPVDEADKVPEFFSFRAQLQAAVARRDMAAVEAALSPKATLNYGGGPGGASAFKRQWSGANANRLWTELGTVLALGGAFAPDGSFSASYVHARWPDELDGMTHVAVTGAEVRVRAQPRADATALDSVSFVILPMLPGPQLTRPWVGVKLPDGRSGYIDRRYARSPLDYRAGFAKTDGRWQMTYFVAGD